MGLDQELPHALNLNKPTVRKEVMQALLHEATKQTRERAMHQGDRG